MIKRSLYRRLIIFPLSFFFICGCAIHRNNAIPLKQFITSLSKDIACLEYCSNKKGQYLFAINDPIDVTLGLTASKSVQGNISGNNYAVPLLISATGSKSNSSSLHMKLYLVEHYDSIKIIYYTKKDKSENVTNSSSYKNVTLFHQIINNTEYLYVIGNKKEDEKYIHVIERHNMDEIKEIDILKAGNNYKECKCE